MIDGDMIACWRANYGLDKHSPADAMRWWNDNASGMAPAGAVAALGLALEELAALRRDALRYRFARAWSGTQQAHWNATPEQFDAAIDAAMEKAP